MTKLKCNKTIIYCGEKDERRDHLFFTYLYTFTVWMNVVEKTLRYSNNSGLGKYCHLSFMCK